MKVMGKSSTASEQYYSLKVDEQFATVKVKKGVTSILHYKGSITKTFMRNVIKVIYDYELEVERAKMYENFLLNQELNKLQEIE